MSSRIARRGRDEATRSSVDVGVQVPHAQAELLVYSVRSSACAW